MNIRVINKWLTIMKSMRLLIIMTVIFILGLSFFFQKPITHVAIDQDSFYKASGATEAEIVKGIKTRGSNPYEKQWGFYKYSSTSDVEIVLENEKKNMKAKIEFYYVKYGNQAIRLYKPQIVYQESDDVIIKSLTTISYSIGKRDACLTQGVSIEKKASKFLLKKSEEILIEIKDL